jgi:SpoIID/LytB domain protein
MRAFLVASALLAVTLLPPDEPRADETSTGDKLRILYTSRVTFTGEGDPLVTVGIMGGQTSVALSAPGGLVAMPDGDGGAEVRAGDGWTVTIEDGAPAEVREWTVVERVAAADSAAAEAAVARWRGRGLKARTFETGSLFAVDGDVMDSRVVLVGVDPVAPSRGADRARALAAKYGVATEVHRELVRRPRGAVVARSGTAVVKNASVVWFAPASPREAIEVKDVITGDGGSSRETGRQDRRYLGRVYVAVGADGKLAVVNAISAERLLAGLVPSEMFPTAPSEALKAQAIAARTELLQKIGTRHDEDPFQVCSTQHCQVYSGAGHEHARATAAVEATRGQVLLRDAGGLVDARYSADCGGHGEHNDTIWGGEADPVLRGHRDAAAGGGGKAAAPWSDGVGPDEVAGFLSSGSDGSYCGATRQSRGRHRWEVDIDGADMDRLVGAVLPRVGHVVAIEPLERGVSGRIRRVRVRGQRGTQELSGDLAIRRLFGGLKSSLFTVGKMASGGFHFRGAGFGHGVGMCQLGAIGMAQAHKAVADILRHYYPNSRIHALY